MLERILLHQPREPICGKLQSVAYTHGSLAMPSTLELLEAEALKLAPADRSRLAERLVASLDEDEETEAAWDAVADAREAAIGPSSKGAVSFESAMTRLEARFPG